jgi:hypothetical protein
MPEGTSVRKVNEAALLIALVATLGCEPAERGDRGSAPRLPDTAPGQDTAAAVGDSVMARDTMP